MSDLVSKYGNIRQKHRIVERLPWIGGDTSTALYPNVYLSRSTYKSIVGPIPDPYKVSILLHEEEHIARIKKIGVYTWYWRYVTNRKFRFEEELAACAPQFSYLKGLGLTLDLERRARILSGHLYFWPMSYAKALERLVETWSQAK